LEAVTPRFISSSTMETGLLFVDTETGCWSVNANIFNTALEGCCRYLDTLEIAEAGTMMTLVFGQQLEVRVKALGSSPAKWLSAAGHRARCSGAGQKLSQSGSEIAWWDTSFAAHHAPAEFVL